METKDQAKHVSRGMTMSLLAFENRPQQHRGGPNIEPASSTVLQKPAGASRWRS